MAMTSITATPDIQTSTMIHINFVASDGTKFDQWRNRADWEKDSQAETAKVFNYLNTGITAQAATSAIIAPTPVAMTAAQVATKLATL